MVAFAVSREAAFDYLTDPRNRPEWQWSLRAVEVLDDDVGEGQRWVDVTWAGLRPRLRTTVFERPARWEEHGEWRGLRVRVALSFRATPSGCEVDVTCPWMARFVATRDLRHAARVLGQR